MLTDNEKLVMLMRKKQEKLNEIGIKSPKYVNKKDEKEILSWDKKTSKNLWKEFKDNVKHGIIGFTMESCPFCLHKEYMDSISTCNSCVYGKNHLMCGDEDENGKYINTYSIVKIKIEQYELDHNCEVFNKKYFTTIITEINKMTKFEK